MEIPTPEAYASTADTLVERIKALIPEHPEIMNVENPFDLFKMGLNVDDLQPSLFQAAWALSKAKFDYREEHGDVIVPKKTK